MWDYLEATPTAAWDTPLEILEGLFEDSVVAYLRANAHEGVGPASLDVDVATGDEPAAWLVSLTTAGGMDAKDAESAQAWSEVADLLQRGTSEPWLFTITGVEDSTLADLGFVAYVYLARTGDGRFVGFIVGGAR